MRQRVGLARALTVDADIILMDEPFSSVDEQTRRKFQEDMLDLLRHRQKTVIFVTHSIEEAAYLSDQIVLLSPRPGTVSQIIRPNVDRGRKSPDEIRRDKNYLDAVDEIWRHPEAVRRDWRSPRCACSARRSPSAFSLLFWFVVWELVGRAGLIQHLPAAVQRSSRQRSTILPTEKFIKAAEISLRSFAMGMALALIVGIRARAS